MVILSERSERRIYCDRRRSFVASLLRMTIREASMNPIGRSLALIAALSFAAVAQTPAPATVADQYDHHTVMIAMRDGVRLNTEIFIPKGAAEPLPILFRRSPYGVSASSILAAAPN